MLLDFDENDKPMFDILRNLRINIKPKDDHKDDISYEEYTFLTENFRTRTGGLDEKKIRKAIEGAETKKEKEELKAHLITLLPLIDINQHTFDIFYILGLICPFVGKEPILNYLNMYKAQLSGYFSLEWLGAQHTRDEKLLFSDRLYAVLDFLEEFLQEEDHPLRSEAEKFIEKALKALGANNFSEPEIIHSFFILLDSLLELNEEDSFVKKMLLLYKDHFKKGIEQMNFIYGGLYLESHGFLESILDYYDNK
jgi:hypothetical protein